MLINSLKKLWLRIYAWKSILITGILIYISFAVLVFWGADRMIFLPQPASYDDSSQVIKLTNPDGSQISAYYRPNPQAKYTILYAHGNAEDLGNILPKLDRLYAMNLSIFAYDYRGYGTSEGTPSEANAYEDIETAYNYLTENLQINSDRIIAFGFSVGGGSVVDLAARRAVAGLIVESTFTSAFRVKFPFPILPFDKFPNRKKIKRVQSPVLILHGKVDDVIPFNHGQQLYAAANQPKMSLWIENANHNDLSWVAGDRYEQAIDEFLQMVDKNR